MRRDDPDGGESPAVPVWFVGDLDDPWVAAIADALPATAQERRITCPGDLPEALFDRPEPPATLVLHRSVLTRTDAECLARLRARRTPPRVVLCVGSHVRHVDLERWAPLVDAVVPEATARETIARHLAAVAPEHLGATARRSARGPARRPPIVVVSTSSAMRQAVAEAVEAAGYPAVEACEWLDAPPCGPAVWDVPVLEPGWPEALARRARVGPVLALIGFASRGLVTLARAHGASGCLELPFDLADLATALDRLAPALAPARNEPAHPTPPPPSSYRRAVADRSPRVAGSGRGS